MSARIRLLGDFRIEIDGRQIPAAAWPRRHAAALVKLLALRPGHQLHRDRVIDTLWPDLQRRGRRAETVQGGALRAKGAWARRRGRAPW